MWPGTTKLETKSSADCIHFFGIFETNSVCFATTASVKLLIQSLNSYSEKISEKFWEPFGLIVDSVDVLR